MKKAAALIIALLLTSACLPAYAGGVPARGAAGICVSGFSAQCIDGSVLYGQVFTEYEASAVTYFATWSADCLRQLDMLAAIKAAHPEYGVFGLLRVDATSTPEAALAIMTERGYDFPVMICEGDWQAVAEDAFVIPQTFIIDRSGVIAEAWQAAFSSAQVLLARLMRVSFGPPDGDADLNGSVNSADALLVLRAALGLIVPSDDAVLHADMDQSGALDSQDALMILRIALAVH